MKSKTYSSRKFLNSKEGLAAIQISAEMGNFGLSANVNITDCSRMVNLDFYSYEEKTIKKRLDKLQILIDELTKLKTFIVSNQEEMIEAMKQYKKTSKSIFDNPLPLRDDDDE